MTIGTYTDHLIISSSSTTGDISLRTIRPARNTTGTRITGRLGLEAALPPGKIITDVSSLRRMNVISPRSDIGPIGSSTVSEESMMKRAI
jgi:hypothetical protein